MTDSHALDRLDTGIPGLDAIEGVIDKGNKRLCFAGLHGFMHHTDRGLLVADTINSDEQIRSGMPVRSRTGSAKDMKCTSS